MNDDPKDPGRLLAEFPIPTLEQWRQEVERLLKGVPFELAMTTRTAEGIAVAAMTTAADVGDLPWLSGLPGQAPFVRGSRPGGHRAVPWLVAQELPLPAAAAFNAALCSDLQRGQTAVNLVLDTAGQQGCDPDQAALGTVGMAGTSIADLKDLQEALTGVDLASTPVFIDSGVAALPVAAMVAALCGRSGVPARALSGCLGCDPVFGLARHGRVPAGLDALYDQLAVLTHWASDTGSSLRTLPINETPWHEGGADSALSLALTLADGVHALRRMELRGLDLAVAIQHIQFNVCIGTDFFMETAKLRALRLLWSAIQTAAGLTPAAPFIHARTSRRTLAACDPHVNMLRVTTGALSAVLGGADSLHTSAYDEPLGPAGEFSRRIARNVQLILAHEVHADQVADPAGGAWYIERLTADLAAKVWEHFQRIEGQGGILAGLEAGRIQAAVAACAADRAERLATRRDVMVGVNQYTDSDKNSDERARTARTFDQAAFQAARAAAIASRRPHTSVTGWGLDPLTAAAAAGVTVSGLLQMVQAAPADPGVLADLADLADLAEIAVEPIPLRRDAAPFEELPDMGARA